MVKCWVALVAFALTVPHGLTGQALTHEDGSTADAAAVVDTVRAMYAAAAKDDLAAFHAVTAQGFYAFDNGVRYDGDALMQMVMSYHAKGVKIVWTVTNPDVHVHGDVAQIAYTNVGSIQMNPPAPVQPVSWLESAYFERRGGTWKMVFFQSERVAVAPAN